MAFLKQNSIGLLLLSILASEAYGQGLIPDKSAQLSSSGSLLLLSKLYKNSAAWKEAFKESPRSACSASNAVSLCSAGTGSKQQELERQAQLVVATSPVAYSSANPDDTGGLNLVGAARDQRPCGACVGFAVAAAAQTAIAAAKRVNASTVEPLSVYDLLYCGTQSAAACRGGAVLVNVLDQLTQRNIAPDACLPFAPPGTIGSAGGGADKAPQGSAAPQCLNCVLGDGTGPSPLRRHEQASEGTFTYRALSDEWSVAQFIREHGAVVSRFDIYSDFEPFFKNPKNKDAVYRPSPTAKLIEPHAVAIVGYNLSAGYWLALNSWGPKFGDKGLFKVAFGAANIAKAPDLYGIQWSPNGGTDFDTPPLDSKGCFPYMCRKGDYIAGLARRFNAPIERMLLDNAATIQDLDRPISGLRLEVCGSKRPLEVAAETMKAAAAAGELGVSFTGGGYLSYYHAGVLGVLKEAGLVGPKTKMSGLGQAVHCLLCANGDLQQYTALLDGMRKTCSKMLNCLSIADRTLRAALTATSARHAFPAGSGARCRAVCYSSISVHNPQDTTRPERGVVVSDYKSDADFVDTLLASSFIPLFSNSRPSLTYRGQEVSSGVFTGFIPPPPPGVRYCIRVSPLPAPQVGGTLDFRMAMSAYGKIQRSMSLDDLFGPGKGAAAAATALAYKPSNAGLQAAAEQALKLGVDIAPNLFTPLPLVDPSVITDVVVITPTDELAAFLFKLGQKDATHWAQAVKVPLRAGVGGSTLARGLTLAGRNSSAAAAAAPAAAAGAPFTRAAMARP